MSTLTTTPSGSLMNYDKLYETRDSLTVRMVRIVNVNPGQSGGRYWRPNYNGYTDSVTDAGVFSIPKVIEDTLGSTVLYELVDESKPEQEKKEMIHLLFAQLSYKIDTIGAKMCRIVDDQINSPDRGKYWRKPMGSGCTWRVEESLEMRISTLIHTYGNVRGAKVEMLDQESAAEIAKMPFRRCVLGNCVLGTIVLGLQLQPNNPTYRAQLLQAFGVMPPAEITTFEALKDWIEFNCDPPEYSPPSYEPSRLPADDGLSINLAFADTVTGTCDYYQRRHAYAAYRFSHGEMLDMIRNSQTLADLRKEIDDKLQRSAWGCHPHMEDEGRPTYDNHQEDGIDNKQWEYRDSNTARNVRIEAYLLAHAPPDELRRLGIMPPPPAGPPPPDPFDDFELQPQQTGPDREPLF